MIKEVTHPVGTVKWFLFSCYLVATSSLCSFVLDGTREDRSWAVGLPFFRIEDLPFA